MRTVWIAVLFVTLASLPFGLDEEGVLGARARGSARVAQAAGGPAPMGTPRSNFPLVRAGDGRLYAIGGLRDACCDPSAAVASVEAFDIGANTWTGRAPLPVALRDHGAVSGSNGNIYVFGGWTAGSTLSAAVYEYLVASDQWVARTPWPSARQGAGAARASDGRIYLAGGFGAGQAVDVYDPSSDAWSTAPGLATGRFNAGVVSVGGELYTFGGCPAFGCGGLTSVERFGVPSGPWVGTMAMPASRYGYGSGVVGQVAYVVGGSYFGAAVKDEVFAFDVPTQTWSERLRMPTRRFMFGMAAGDDGRLYAAGGQVEPFAVVPTLEVYDPAGDRWVTEDGAPPVLTTVSINGGAQTTTSTVVTLALQASDPAGGSGLAGMRFSNDGGASWSAWEPYAATRSWALSAGPDGPRTVQARVRDAAGNESAVVGDEITLSSAVGTSFGVSINAAAVWTNTVDVTLTIAAAPGTARMMVSNDGGFGGATWEPYNASRAWRLDRFEGSPVTMIVYVRFGDANSQEIGGSTRFDNIVLDIQAPTGSVTVPTTGAPGQGVAAPVRAVRLTASDDLSGAGMTMRLSNRADFAGAHWQPFNDSVTWDFNGGGTIYAQFRDGAGNLSQAYSQGLAGGPGPGTSPSPSSCAPRPRIEVAARKDGPTLLVTLATTGENNGLRAVRFDSFQNALVDVVDVADQRNQGAPFALSIPPGQEPTSLRFAVRRQTPGQPTTVRLVVFDGCGEWSTFVGGGPDAF